MKRYSPCACNDIARPMTNADHIRSMTDEQLADFSEGEYGNMETGRALGWLKQPYKECE